MRLAANVLLMPLLSCLGMFALPVSAQMSEGARTHTLIKAARLVDVRAGRFRDQQWLLIEGGYIKAVGPAGSLAVPADARVIDLADRTLMPGLIDTHVHLTSDPTIRRYDRLGLSVPRLTLIGAANARRTLLAGFTTVRNVGAPGYSDVALRDAIAAGDIPGPRMLVSGPSVGILGGHCDNTLLAPEFHYQSEGVANGPVGVRVAVRRNVKYGADLIKFCGTGGVFSKGTRPGAQQFTADEMAALVDEAHMHGRKVAVHAHGAEGIKTALRAGVDTIEHASLIDDEGLQLAKQLGVYLSMDIYNTDYTQSEGRRRGELEAFLRKDAEIGETQRENFRRAVKAGVKLTFATDAGVYPHGDNGKQFAIMVRYGMTSAQALHAATINGADALGLAGEIGEIAVGQRADVIAVEGDPLSDVTRLENVEFVMKDGWVYKEP